MGPERTLARGPALPIPGALRGCPPHEERAERATTYPTLEKYRSTLRAGSARMRTGPGTKPSER